MKCFHDYYQVTTSINQVCYCSRLLTCHLLSCRNKGRRTNIWDN